MMARFLRGRGRAAEAEAGPEVPIPPLVGELQAAALAFAARPLDPPLVLARLGDGLRARGLAPIPASHAVALTAPLDREGWTRLALATAALEGEAMAQAWPELAAARGVAKLVEGMSALALTKTLVTLALVRESEHRAEELARGLLRELGASVRGETPSEAEAHLERLDYARLLGRAEDAKREAEQRLEQLRLLQARQAGAVRRGKW